MYSEKEYDDASAEIKALKQKIGALQRKQERLQAALYLASGWTPEQILRHRYGRSYDFYKGDRIEIRRMIEFTKFLNYLKRVGREAEYDMLHFHQFEWVHKQVGTFNVSWDEIEKRLKPYYKTPSSEPLKKERVKMSNAQVHDMAIERAWLDGLKAIDEQYDEAETSRHRWIRIGNGMLAGRTLCPSHQDFRDWIDTTGYRVIPRNERQDAMWMALNQSIALRVLAETRIGNPEWARRHIREKLPEIYARCSDVSFTEASVNEVRYSPVAEITEKPAAAPVNEAVAPIETEPVEPDPTEVKTRLIEIIAKHAETLASEVVPLETTETATPTDKTTRLKRAELPRIPVDDTRWRLAKKPHADLVRAHITDKTPRVMLGTHLQSRGTAPMWDLLVASIIGGYYGPPARGTNSPGLHLVLPWFGDNSFARSFDLREAHSRKEVKEIIFPLLDRMPELRLPENHRQIEGLVKIERRRIADERHAAAKLARHQNVVNAHNFAVGEQQIIAYGEPLWPQDAPRYTYQELCHACWYVKFWLGLAAAAKWTPTTTGMQGRHLIKYIEPLAPGTVLAVYDVLNAYQQNPDGETTIPTVPVNFGHGR